MLEKIIKKEHQRIIFSFYGIVTMFAMLIPLAMLGFGIWFQISKVNQYGILWIVVGAVGFLFSLKKLRDFFPVFKYAAKPKSFKSYKAMIDDGLNPADFDDELEKADVLSHLNKKSPLYETENFIFGYSQVNFFFLKKEDIVWAYEYNGNGLVFLDRHGIYGFTFYQTVDGNDEAMKHLKEELPYIYFGTDFDYKTKMHDEFQATIEEVSAERDKFLANPDGYREAKEREEKERIEEESKRLEEEKNRQMAELDKEHKDDADLASDSIKEDKDANLVDLENKEQIEDKSQKEEGKKDE